jgi:uncharacterized OB-fold protein
MDLHHSSKEDDHPYTKPLPRITPLNKPSWEFAARSIFALQTCDACGDVHVPPSPVCPRCLSEDQTWKPSSGRGTLESWVDFHRAYWDGFKSELPYRVCLVRLNEGPLFVSNLIGDQTKARVGALLHVMFEPATENIALPKFVLD